MSIPVRSIVIEAFRLTGIIDDIEVPNANQTAGGVDELNDVIAELNMQQHFAFTDNVLEFSLSASSYEFTIGTSASDVTDERPITIQRLTYSPSTNGVPYTLIQIPTKDLFSKRTTQNAQGTPYYFSYDGGYPEAKIRFDIKPQAGGQFVLIYNKDIAQVTIDDTLTIPPEYYNVVKLHLASALSVRYFAGQETLTNLQRAAANALKPLKQRNSYKNVAVWADRTNRNRNNILAGEDW